MPIVRFTIRKARKEDFFDLQNKPRYGTLFFLKNSKGEFDNQPYYLTIDTDKEDFRKWFKSGQVYVFTKVFEELNFEEDVNERTETPIVNAE